MTQLLNEIHPGEILLEEFMKPMGLSAQELASSINASTKCICQLVNGKRPFTINIGKRLGILFEVDPLFWVNLQNEFDMRIAYRSKLSACN